MDNDQAIQELGQGLWELARAVESLAQTAGDNNALNQARRAKRAGSEYR